MNKNRKMRNSRLNMHEQKLGKIGFKNGQFKTKDAAKTKRSFLGTSDGLCGVTFIGTLS